MVAQLAYKKVTSYTTLQDWHFSLLIDDLTFRMLLKQTKHKSRLTYSNDKIAVDNNSRLFQLLSRLCNIYAISNS